MAEVTVDALAEAFDLILKSVGEESFVDWEKFTQNSNETMKAIDELSRTLSVFREAQHRTFISALKKLKGLDVPDLVKTVQGKKLPKEALRAILPRFSLVDDKPALKEDPAFLR